MKKILFILSVFVLISTSSCKKTYTCYCVNAVSGATTNPTVKAANSSDASADCVAIDQGANGINCSLP